MKQQTKIGVIAVGIVVGITGLGGIVVGGVILARGSGNVKVTDEKPITLDLSKIQDEADYTKKQFEYVRRHGWWKHSLTESALDQIIAAIIKSNSGFWAYIRQDGKIDIREDLSDYAHGQHDTPDGWNGWNVIYIKIQGGKRFDKLGVLRTMVSELDSAEFKNGPGR